MVARGLILKPSEIRQSSQDNSKPSLRWLRLGLSTVNEKIKGIAAKDHQLLYATGETALGLNDGEFKWFRGRAGVAITQGQGDLAAASKGLQANLPVILVLPAHNALLTNVDVPNIDSKKQRSVLPFMLQQQVLGDVADLHLAWHEVKGQRGQKAKGKVSLQVAGYNKQELNTLLLACETHGLHISKVVLDAQLLPQQHQQWTLLADTGGWLLSYGKGYACSILQHMVPLVVQQLLQQLGQQLGQQNMSSAHTTISIYGTDAQHAKQLLQVSPFAHCNIQLSTHTPPINGYDTLSLLSYFYQDNSAICLLPARKINDRLHDLWQAPVVKLGCYCLLVAVMTLWVANHLLQQRLQQVQMSYERLQQPIAAELARLNIPQTLPERVAELSGMRLRPDTAINLLGTWARLRTQLSLADEDVVLTRMVYGQKKLTLTWQVSSAAAAKKQADALAQYQTSMPTYISASLELAPELTSANEAKSKVVRTQILHLNWQGDTQ
jgi:type II secretion system protein L